MKRIFTLLMGMVIVCGLLFGVVPNVNAVTYQWSTLDYPGAFWTTAHGIDASNIVGGYGFSPNERHGFLYNGTTVEFF